jgi:purine-binding chemotaxis protein CheW
MFRCGAVCAALPLGDVRETLRPLQILAIESAPSFVLGMAIIRGMATAVIDGARLLDPNPAAASAPPGRFITLRVTERPVALAVDAVVGIQEISTAAMAALPPLLGASEHGPIEQLARLDSDLWMLLRAGRLVPELADFDFGASAASA